MSLCWFSLLIWGTPSIESGLPYRADSWLGGSFADPIVTGSSWSRSLTQTSWYLEYPISFVDLAEVAIVNGTSVLDAILLIQTTVAPILYAICSYVLFRGVLRGERSARVAASIFILAFVSMGPAVVASTWGFWIMCLTVMICIRLQRRERRISVSLLLLAFTAVLAATHPTSSLILSTFLVIWYVALYATGQIRKVSFPSFSFVALSLCFFLGWLILSASAISENLLEGLARFISGRFDVVNEAVGFASTNVVHSLPNQVRLIALVSMLCIALFLRVARVRSGNLALTAVLIAGIVLAVIDFGTWRGSFTNRVQLLVFIYSAGMIGEALYAHPRITYSWRWSGLKPSAVRKSIAAILCVVVALQVTTVYSGMNADLYSRPWISGVQFAAQRQDNNNHFINISIGYYGLPPDGFLILTGFEGVSALNETPFNPVAMKDLMRVFPDRQSISAWYGTVTISEKMMWEAASVGDGSRLSTFEQELSVSPSIVRGFDNGIAQVFISQSH